MIESPPKTKRNENATKTPNLQNTPKPNIKDNTFGVRQLADGVFVI